MAQRGLDDLPLNEQAGVLSLLASARGTVKYPHHRQAPMVPALPNPRRCPSYRGWSKGQHSGKGSPRSGPPQVCLLGAPSWGAAGRKKRSCYACFWALQDTWRHVARACCWGWSAPVLHRAQPKGLGDTHTRVGGSPSA